jgi:nucleotide-binding universal stress UspA family protein
MAGTILLPIDGGDATDRAIEQALSVAERGRDRPRAVRRRPPTVR